MSSKGVLTNFRAADFAAFKGGAAPQPAQPPAQQGGQPAVTPAPEPVPDQGVVPPLEPQDSADDTTAAAE